MVVWLNKKYKLYCGHGGGSESTSTWTRGIIIVAEGCWLIDPLVHKAAAELPEG